MGIVKSGSSPIRKILKVGKGSLAVTLPIDLVRKLRKNPLPKEIIAI